jgi:amino-acid N-acetyltransferase
LVKLGASNVSNKVLTLLSENGAQGVVGNWVKARGMGVIEGRDFQNTGMVDSVNIPVIKNLVEKDHIPIISNIGWSSSGKPYNISSNELAVALAKSIQASKLFFISSRKGVPSVSNCKVQGLGIRECGVYSNLEIGQAQELLNHHEADLEPNALEIVKRALEACRAGVDRVHVIDGGHDGVLLQEIFSTSGQGTMFHANIYSNIRRARSEDIPGILRIMQPYVNKGFIIQRNAEGIAEKLDSFYVYSVDEVLHGCGALSCYSSGAAEIEAVVVDHNYSKQGTGKKIVSYLLERAKEMDKKLVFVLTTQSSDYFMNLGFAQDSIDVLPQEKKEAFNKDRNSKVLTKRL